ncbi:sulfatase-like hydrolase/transferase [Parasutterella secunda]|uniref:sulfatase-like hydrolase/transferase n=1 Tax=Parasutterella secunda TaxID=626947 RepID=UPI0025A4B794|nr:sulfatase-like hydrolase/transferase [Parasutterella secunda]MDM8087686.1 sulfatase-like hydrolase/transferase [Parasutterella secunda]
MENKNTKNYSLWAWLLLPLWCLTLLILFPPQTLDIAISGLFFDTQGWPLKNDFFFNVVLYKSSKIIPIGAALASVYVLVKNLIANRRGLQPDSYWIYRPLYIIIAMLACVLVVWWLKASTGVYCPWSVSYFSGDHALREPTWSWVFQDGRCWPSGHSGTGFCLLALFFALRDKYPQLARKTLVAVLLLGIICSLTRIVQGAHFLSHTLATALIDWIICAGLYVLCFDRQNILRRILALPRKIAFNHFLFLSAFFWTVCFNAPIVSSIIKSASADKNNLLPTLILALAVSVSVFFLSMSIIALLGLLPRLIFKGLMILLTLLGATSLVVWLYYGIAMTPDMVRNFLATDIHEASGYWSWSLALNFILITLPGLLLINRLRSSRRPESKLKRLGICVITLLCGVFVLFIQLQPFSALMRGDKSLRYLFAPVNIVYSASSTLLRDQNPEKAQKVIVDASPKAIFTSDKPTLFVVLIGETARSANWQLANYEKATNPELSKLNIVNIPKVQACGTSTDVSLPCMLSRVGRRDYDRKRILTEESLPSLLKRAGFSVTWVDNQSGCKGTCDGVRVTKPTSDPLYCHAGACMDGVFNRSIDEAFDALNTQSHAVLFLHMMGSHGPAYYKRSTESEKVFGKECTDPTFKSCSKESIRAAYDSSIRYTDRVVAELIRKLQNRTDINTALIYLSDHGESLGENGLYLHGAPYYIAPDEQKIVPMVMWFSEPFKKNYTIDTRVIEENSHKPVAHDHLYHTILGLLNVRSSTYDSQWDLSVSHAK